MADLEKEITRLTDLWYELVNLDHHKDRDCHWYINKTWSYGEPPTYQVEHYGYVYHDVIRPFKTEEKAERFLLNELKAAFLEEDEWADDVLADPKNWGEDQAETAKKIKEITAKALK